MQHLSTLIISLHGKYHILATMISTIYHCQTKDNNKLHHPRVGQIKRNLEKNSSFPTSTKSLKM